MARMIDFYNTEVDRYQAAGGKSEVGPSRAFVDKNPKKINWDRIQFKGVERGRKGLYNDSGVMRSVYRPFSKTWTYFDRFFNNCVYQMPKIFPVGGTRNRAIAVSGIGSSDFSVLMVDLLPCFDVISKSQCFPRYLYKPAERAEAMPGWQDAEAQAAATGYRSYDALTDGGLAHIQSHYPGEPITKDDVFYYVYGLLHSPDYREQFGNNLSRALPCIPCVASSEDFWAFVKAGRDLGDLHVDYESVEPYPAQLRITGDRAYEDLTADDLRVNKPWKYGGKGKNKDRSVVLYNDTITITGIPVEAYDYVVNGKPALQWIMERQRVKTDKKSGIVSDANDYAVETMGNPAYPLELFQRVITVSLETLEIIRGLPPMMIDES